MNKLITQFSDLPTDYCLLCDNQLQSRYNNHKACYGVIENQDNGEVMDMSKAKFNPELALGAAHYYIDHTMCVFNIDFQYSFSYRADTHMIQIFRILSSNDFDLFIYEKISSIPLDFSDLPKLKASFTNPD